MIIKKARIYLACPYSDPDPAVRRYRYMAVTAAAAAQLTKFGSLVFSPVTHSHYLAEQFGCSQDGGFWKDWYLSFLEHWATHLYVLQLQGWEESKGVNAEIDYAERHNIPIRMMQYYVSIL